MNFKVGDLVRTKAVISPSGNSIGPLTECEVIVAPNSWGVCEVKPTGTTTHCMVWASDLEYIPALPSGNQMLLEAIDNGDVNFREAYKLSPKCDCGGLKTHGSLESIFHSHWCS